MILPLKTFQEAAVDALLGLADVASHEVEKIKNTQALVLSSPTGSGKTVIATALMERISNGYEDHEEDPNATFLWLTDMPELNEQTRRKIEATSDVFDGTRLVTVEASSFNQKTFDPGTINFLNTQKLGKNSSLVKRGDKQGSTIWQTIQNTVEERPGSFWVVIDEAHRGTQESKTQREDARTIMQRFIKGYEEVGLDPVPLILGISATPKRFSELIEGTPRIKRPVDVPPEDVRSSGLLKESITLFHTDEDQPSDLTLLGAAAAKTDEYADGWSDYAKKAKETSVVRPILLVQVEDGTKTKLTKTDLVAALDMIQTALPDLEPDEIGHAFQEGADITVGEQEIRYVAPSDIEEDKSLRVVLFKMSLTTGWDCPRAEVMMSFRTAKDEIYIAQLVGRMVRTPLARTVTDGELLNSVALFLPYYDRDALDQIIERLSRPDPDQGLPGIKVERGNNLVELKRNEDLQAAFDTAEGLPIYRVSRISTISGIRRLLKLGRRLEWDGLDDSAIQNFESALVDVLDAERRRLKGDKGFKERIEEAGLIEMRGATVAAGETKISKESTEKLAVSARNLDDAFDDTGRKLGGGLHLQFAKRRAADKGAPKLPDIKRELYALLGDSGLVKKVEAEAEKLCEQALDKHRIEIKKLPEEVKEEYRQIQRWGTTPTPEEWELPESIQGPKEGKHYDKHLYVKEDGSYTCKLNEWEEEVVSDRIADPNTVAWLRNDPRKPWALSINYVLDGHDRPMYPDFLFFRKEGDEIVCDIVEPHSLSWADSAAKAKGLAEFAQKHAQEFGQIELIAKVKGAELKSLNLHDPETLTKVRTVANNEALTQIVEAAD